MRLFQGNLVINFLGVAIQVGHHETNFVIALRGISRLPGKGLTIESEHSLVFLGKCLLHFALRIELEPIFQDREAVAGLCNDLMRSACLPLPGYALNADQFPVPEVQARIQTAAGGKSIQAIDGVDCLCSCCTV
jgi:hypothetical protein